MSELPNAMTAATAASANAMASVRRPMMQLNFKERGALYAAFIPAFKDGGIFVPTQREYRLGEDIYLIITLPNDLHRYPIQGKVAWITPANASAGRTQGVGVRFPADEKSVLICSRIREVLAQGKRDPNSPHPTQTL